ncbi:MAG: PBP1A family penicillin-binding protein [Actinomycetota bacterium]|nr:PBP1A family penicillin-binding protein [Actinomycetota bacterium]
MALSLVGALAGSGCTLHPIELGEERPLALRSTIRAADGSFLARFYKENRSPVELEDVSPKLVDAVLAAEDTNFYKHAGYDLRAIARALVVNIDEGEVVQGGSTITQQYVKNTFFRNPARTLERKTRELRLALEVERLYSKREILERYLNTVYLGHGAYGVQAAAETYFRHSAGSLTTREAALIAGLIKAPSDYDPYLHPKKARQRRRYVLDRLVATDRLPARVAARIAKSGLGVANDPPLLRTRQPYFVGAVRQEILNDERLGPSAGARDKLLHEGGLEIDTTLDRELQREAQRAVEGVLNRRGDPQAALVAIRPKTGEIVAMVGGRDWSTSQVNLALGAAGGGSGRQPGSSFKPLAAAAAMEAGIPLSQEYDSAPAVLDLGQGETWSVSNAEGQDYGAQPLDEALVRSINGVYARLALEIGGGAIASQARLMGVKSQLPSLPSIALGATEVSVLDMAAAYSTLANGGTAVEPTTIESLRTANGKIYEPDQEVIPGALSAGNAYLLTRVLEDVIVRGTGMAANIGRPAAGKTGTTDDYADAWFVGYTPHLVTAVWVGYPEGRIPMTSVHGVRVMGGTLPAQIWQRFMSVAHEGVPMRDFELPREELVTVAIDPETGLLAAPWCKGKEKTMLRQLVPTEQCPLPPPPPEPSPSPSPEPEETRSPSPSPSPSPTVKDPKGVAPEEEAEDGPVGPKEGEEDKRPSKKGDH